MPTRKRNRKETEFRYRLYGSRIASSIPLADLPAASFRKPEFRFTMASKLPTRQSLRWFHRLRDETGRLAASFAQVRTGFVLRYHGSCDFFLSTSGREMVCVPTADKSEETLGTMFLSQALPLALNLAGHEILHASAVRAGGKGFAFLGHSGAGKSTLAAAFIREGHRLLSDDATCFELGTRGPLVVPSTSLVRLYPRTLRQLFAGEIPKGASKHAKLGTVFEKPFLGERTPLAAVYFLDRVSSTAVHRDRLSPREAWLMLLGHSFRLDLFDRARLEREALLLSRIAEAVPFYRLRYPRSLAWLPSVIECITES